jgi:hypothetical protein
LVGSSRSSNNQQLAASPRNSVPISRNGTQSPPSTSTTHQSSARKTSSSSSVTSASSDAGHDEVFGMFYDDDSGSDRYRPVGASGSRRRSSVIEDDTSISSLNDESTDSLESDDESDESTPDAFTGWTDEEIVKSRYMANITKELERVSMKHINKPTTGTDSTPSSLDEKQGE